MVDLFGLEPCKNWDVKTQGYCQEVAVEAVGFSHERRGEINSIAFDLHEQRQPSWGWSSPPSSTDYLLAWKLWVSENITDPYVRELVEAGEIANPEGLVEDDTLPFLLSGGALGVAQRLAQGGGSALLATKEVAFYRAMSNAEYAALEANQGLTYMKGKKLFVSTKSAYSRPYLQKDGMMYWFSLI
ncbi:MAG: hypothetical protein JNN12_02270 [Bacteroidetes Order II. Incertae sedis bacterium]|nr:hypothetical protein [Bacteroidetes Order II. bacterium]